MVKLETPLKLYERIDENMRSIMDRDSSETHREEIKYTVVPLD
jgi:hypothetical protein